MSVQSQQMIEQVWRELQQDIVTIRGQITLLQQRSERAETAGGHATYTFAARPLVNNSGGDEIWISDGRKVGEGAGLGTGVICYWNPSTRSWKLHRDDSDVAV